MSCLAARSTGPLYPPAEPARQPPPEPIRSAPPLSDGPRRGVRGRAIRGRKLMAMALRPEDHHGRGAGPELSTTLRLCVVAFDKALALEDVPRPFRAVVRACKTLCLAALGGARKGRPVGRAR